MARRYAVIFDSISNESVTTPTIAVITSAATVRPAIYDVIVGSRAAVADQACTYDFQRFTAAGTTTPVTPVALNPSDPASLAAGGHTATAEPTYTASTILLKFSVNQRATFRWVAAPGGELVSPATAANGIGFKGNTPTTAFAVDGVIHFEE
jgi:hypothetical protein